MKKFAINMLVDIDNMEFFEDEREAEGHDVWEVSWDTNLEENDDLHRELWNETGYNPGIFYQKWFDAIKMQAVNLKTQERLTGAALYKKLYLSDINGFWAMAQRYKQEMQIQKSIDRSEMDMRDDQMPGHYELYGPDPLTPEANRKMKIKISKSQWETIGRQAKWLRKAECGIVCEKCKQCPEHSGLKICQDGRIRTLCCEAAVLSTDGKPVPQQTLVDDFGWLLDQKWLSEQKKRNFRPEHYDGTGQGTHLMNVSDEQILLNKIAQTQKGWQLPEADIVRNHETTNPPTRGKMHRCKYCWTDVDRTDNGYIPMSQPYPHADHCPYKGRF